MIIDICIQWVHIFDGRSFGLSFLNFGITKFQIIIHLDCWEFCFVCMYAGEKSIKARYKLYTTSKLA